MSQSKGKSAALGDVAEDLKAPSKRIRVASISVPKKLLQKLSLPYVRDTLGLVRVT